MIKKNVLTGIFLLIVFSGLLISCSRTTTSTVNPTVYSAPELKYLLIANFGGVFYCDPDFYPVARLDLERQNAVEQFPIIKANQEEFTAILKHLNLLDKDDYTIDEKVLIYREHKKLTLGIVLTGNSSPYSFEMRVGENQGFHYEGNITHSGKITVTSKESSFNTCPICLPKGTLIDTPGGPTPVEILVRGMPVWTVDKAENRIEALLIKTTMTAIPANFLMVKITLDDGRSITASPGHPSATKITLGDYKAGDTLDGANVVTTEYILYNGLATFDILPSGTTGEYWANRVLLESTLR